MTLAATFLAGAKSRLLPASIPFRFFAAAAAFHVAMWVVLLVAGEHLPGFVRTHTDSFGLCASLCISEP
ncbi:MAG: hypothetical protein HC869_03965 [Rhodospirillales bacterium]|nr:hypothetical protein [Rhodospirillales bacterium]